MNKKQLLTTVVFGVITTFSVCLQKTECNVTSKQAMPTKKVFSEKQLINDALKRFKEIVNNKTKHLERITCTYEENQATTKVYYLDYHQPSYLYPTSYIPSPIKPNQEITILYKSNEKNLTIIYKPKKHSKTINIPSWFFS